MLGWGMENLANAVGVTRKKGLYTSLTELILPVTIDLNGYIVFVLPIRYGPCEISYLDEWVVV